MNTLDKLIVILDRPQQTANIGAVVRAMKNMDVAHLRLVNPAPFARNELLRMAHRCDDLVDGMVICQTIDEALADTVYVVGAAGVPHPEHPQTGDIRTFTAQMIQRAQDGRVALLFGTERDGLDIHALDRCHLIASLPVNPAYASLNLAQSVLLFLYELRQAAVAAPVDEHPVTPPAAQVDLERLFQLSEETLTAIDFFRYNPASVLRQLRQIAFRAKLTADEVSLLMAILRKVQRATGSNTSPQA